MSASPDLNTVISNLVHNDRGRLLAALIGGLGDFDLAEDALSDALESALVHWARAQIPDNPQGWLLRVARRKAIDRIRRQARFRARRPELARLAQEDEADANSDTPDIEDRRLALIFTCCHPALDTKSRVALTLRTLGGLSTGEIARAFLDRETTMGQRLSRAKTKIRQSGIAFKVPAPDIWDERLASVLDVLYLIFNEGYAASSGADLVRVELCEDAIFLTRLLDRLKPQEPEIMGLLSLMLSTHARRNARTDGRGLSVPLDEQDRGQWDRALIGEAVALLDAAMQMDHPGPSQIKAAISALHVSAPSAQDTDRAQIVLLYESLCRYEPTPVVFLNRAVAMAQNGEDARALQAIEHLEPELAGYQPYHAARAELLSRLDDRAGALEAYSKAMALAGNDLQKAFLEKRRANLL